MEEQVSAPSQPLTALMVVDDDAFARLEQVVRRLCVGMIDEMVQMTVLTRSRSTVAPESIGPARLVHAPRHPWRWRRPTSEEMLQALGSDRPRVVHCLSSSLAGWARDWAVAWRAPLVVHVTDLVDVRGLGRMQLVDRMSAIATTQRLRDALVGAYPGLGDRVRVVPLGLPAQEEPACLSRPERVPAIVTAVPLTRSCGLHLVLRALHKAVKAGQPAHLFALSSGPGEPTFRRIVKQLDLRSHVTFAGRMGSWSALREAMRGADIYVLPTARPRFTISTLIAMSEGLAVIAPAGTIGDYLIDGQTASLFDPQSPMQLADRLLALLDDRSRARRLGHGALDYIRVHHKPSAMVQAIAELYRQQVQVQADVPSSTG